MAPGTVGRCYHILRQVRKNQDNVHLEVRLEILEHHDPFGITHGKNIDQKGAW